MPFLSSIHAHHLIRWSLSEQKRREKADKKAADKAAAPAAAPAAAKATAAEVRDNFAAVSSA